MMRRAFAWANLAYRFGTHVLLRLPGRAFGTGRDAQRFRDAVLPEGYVPLTAAERELVPASMRCINCGLCALACPHIAAAPASAWEEAWTFVAGPSRSIDRAPLVAAGPTGCASCEACAAVCPTGVPIARMADMLHRLAAPADHDAAA